jgi:hypothetical protein
MSAENCLCGTGFPQHSITAPLNSQDFCAVIEWGEGDKAALDELLTDFKDNLMATFAWSRDGKQLVCSRGAPVRDAILISDTH